MATVQRRGSRVTRQPVSRAVVGGALTETAWLPTSELGFDDWIEHGRRLGVIGRASGWWIGDWLRYGNTEFGERYVRASRITGYDAQTLMNMVYVAAAVPPDERRHALSWSHHAELAALPSEERARWMDRRGPPIVRALPPLRAPPAQAACSSSSVHCHGGARGDDGGADKGEVPALRARARRAGLMARHMTHPPERGGAAGQAHVSA